MNMCSGQRNFKALKFKNFLYSILLRGTCTLYTAKWGMSWGTEVEGAAKWCSISIISHRCAAAVRTPHTATFVKVSNAWTFVGVEFTWRVDRLDEELGRSTVTAGQRVSNNPCNYKPLLVNTEVRSCKYPHRWHTSVMFKHMQAPDVMYFSHNKKMYPLLYETLGQGHIFLFWKKTRL